MKKGKRRQGTAQTRDLPNIVIENVTTEDQLLQYLRSVQDFNALTSQFTTYFASYTDKDLSLQAQIQELINEYQKYATFREDNVKNLLNYYYEEKISTGTKMLVGPYAQESLKESGVLTLQNNPNFPLNGKDVLIGIIDSGIDYLHPVFQYEDGTSKILRLWDMTIKGNPPIGEFLGTEYTEVQINQALEAKRKGEDPYDIVPSIDETGHGTFLAGIAGGRPVSTDQGVFIGVAPDTELVVIKLKEVGPFYRELYSLQHATTPIYNTLDILRSVQYLDQLATTIQKNIVIIIGLGSNLGSHDEMIQYGPSIEKIAMKRGRVITTCAGNEGNTQRHVRLNLTVTRPNAKVEFKVPSQQKSLYFKMYCSRGDKVNLSITTPSGKSSGVFSAKWKAEQQITFPSLKTTILITNRLPGILTGDEEVDIYINEVETGTYTIELYGIDLVGGIVDIWLPRKDWTLPGVEFIQASPEVTVNGYGGLLSPITCGAYDVLHRTLWASSSKGPNRSELLKPDIVAPGVDILGPVPGGTFATKSGSSIAAAYTGGASALLFEWSTSRLEKASYYNSMAIKGLMVTGASQFNDSKYPDNAWGFGALNLLNIFDL